MKKIILLIQLTLALNTTHAQDTCNDNSIMSINGHWKKGSDANMAPDKNLARLTGTIDSISRLFQLAYPDPKGLEAGWYRTMNASPLTANGPTPYNFNSLYKAWYCNTNLHKRMLADETGTWAFACVNNLGWLLTDQYDLLTVKVDNNAVYMLPPQKGTWKGYTTYESSANGAKSRCLILTHGNQLPWKPVTQEQYLNGVKAGWQDQKSISAGSYAKQEESLKTGIAGIQHNSQLKAADKEKIIAGLQKNLDDLQKNKAAQIEKSGKDWNSRIAVIDNCISKNTA
jgi:hypothetical protein